MSTVQSTDTMTDADMEENAPAQEHGRATKAPAGPRRFAGLALAAALLLALGFATGRATDRLWPAGQAGGAPAAVGQPLAADGYAPNALDYREDHRPAVQETANVSESAGPCPGRDLALTGTCGSAGAAPSLASDGYAPNALDYREDHRADAPAYGPDPMNYREDHRLAGPAGSVAPISIERQRFLEWNTQLPTAGAAGPIAAERQRFLEQNTEFPTAGAATPVSAERQRFLEWNTQLPTRGAPTFVPGPSVSPTGPR